MLDTPKAQALTVLQNSNANIIGAPTSVEQQIDPFRKARLVQVFISTDPASKETYAQSGGLALTKTGLEKLAIGASMTFKTTDIQSSKDYCRATVEGFWTNASGETVSDKKTAEIDLDVIFEEAGQDPRKMKEAQQIRKFKIPLCESKAKNRVIRSLLGIRATYTAQDLTKPFVFPSVSFSPDFSDPEIKSAAIQKFLGTSNALYGRSEEPKAIASVQPMQAEVIPESVFSDDVGSYEHPNF